MLDTQFPPWPCFSREEAEAVKSVLLSNRVNYWTGMECRNFEEEFAAWIGAKHAISLANGTVALDIALKALEIGVGDEVIVTPRSFIASASCVVNVGAQPVFADVDENSQNITPESIATAISPRTKAILCVHLAGWPCEMEPIMALAEKHGIAVIEDCAQAHGAKYKGRSVGVFGDVSAWSFCQDKIITTGGEGGMVTTQSSELWSRMWSYKDHGKSWNAVNGQNHPPGFRWVHESFGSNGRMIEMQAAIGRIQLRGISGWTAARQRNANRIWSVARTIPGLRAPIVPAYIEHAAYRCYLFVEPSKLRPGWNRDRVMDEINARGVACSSGSCSEIYLEKAFDGTHLRPLSTLPIARMLGETSLALLVHPTLREEHINTTCGVLSEVMALASI